nr:MAG: hypothetical protein DIU75_22525 [Mycolicibacterium hassiacum]
MRLAQFGGLGVDLEPQDPGWQGAVIAENVDFLPSGMVRQRDPFVVHATLPTTQGRFGVGVLLLPYEDSSNKQYLLAAQVTTDNGDRDTTLHLVTLTDPASVTTLATVTDAVPLAAVNFGGPNVSSVYVSYRGTTGGLNPPVSKITGTTHTPTSGRGWFVAVQPNDNRLIQAGFEDAASSPTGADGSPSTVFFSDPGAPDTYSQYSFVTLAPGDGEEITGVCTWRGLVFVFKETKFAVFYGNSVDETGTTVFNYRMVDLPYRIRRPGNAGELVATAGDDGVYISTEFGILKSTGGVPQDVYGPLREHGAMTYSNVMGVSWALGRLYCCEQFGLPGVAQYLIMDPNSGWMRWWTQNLALKSSNVVAAVLRTPSQSTPSQSTLFLGGSAAKEIWRLNQNPGPQPVLDPANQAIWSRYRTGYADLGTPGAQKALREVLLNGRGEIGFAIDVDDTPAAPPAVLPLLVQFGTSGLTQRRYRQAHRGRNFALTILGGGYMQTIGPVTNTPWAVSRVIAHIRSQASLGRENK